MELTENALAILRARYLLKDGEGQVIETPREMFGRIARAVAGMERLYRDGNAPCWEERFFDLISSLRFLPNSPTIMAGSMARCLTEKREEVQ